MSIGESFSITVIPRRFPTAQGRGMGGFLWDVDVVSQGVFFGFPKGIFFQNFSLNDREVFSGSPGFPWTLSPPLKTP